MVKLLCYKPEGRWFDPSWCHWNFSLTKSFRLHYGPGVDSASNRNEYQDYFLGVKAAGAYGWQPYRHPVPLSRNLGTLTSWNPLGHSRPVMGLIYLTGLDVVFASINLKYSRSYLKTKEEDRGYAVALLDEALRYKSESRGFDSRKCHWNFFF